MLFIPTQTQCMYHRASYRDAAHVPHLPGRHAEIYHSACVPHTQKLKRATGMQHASRRVHNS